MPRWPPCDTPSTKSNVRADRPAIVVPLAPTGRASLAALCCCAICRAAAIRPRAAAGPPAAAAASADSAGLCAKAARRRPACPPLPLLQPALATIANVPPTRSVGNALCGVPLPLRRSVFSAAYRPGASRRLQMSHLLATTRLRPIPPRRRTRRPRPRLPAWAVAFQGTVLAGSRPQPRLADHRSASLKAPRDKSACSTFGQLAL